MSMAHQRSYLGSAYKYWRQTRRWKEQLSGETGANEFRRWRRSISPNRNALDDEEPWITFGARDFLAQQITSTSRVFEWGSGGSTLFLLNRAAEVHTIEHDRQWFTNVQARVASRGHKHWHGQLVPAEPAQLDQDRHSNSAFNTSDWRSYRSGDASLRGYTLEKYVKSIDQMPDAYFDIVIVDGRARPSCICHAWCKIKPGGLLVLDNAEVGYYAPMCSLLRQQCSEYYPFAGAGPYITSFWLTCAWRHPGHC